jgi:hypothetical protein
MQYPMLWVCSVCNAVSYAWNVRLSKQYLMLWAVIKVGDCQERILISGSSTEGQKEMFIYEYVNNNTTQ